MKNRSPLWRLSGSMVIFGTIGILRRYIELPSSFLALGRAVIGTVFLLLLPGSKPDLRTIRAQLPWLALSGTLLGFNWIFLFESYRYTTVTTATLCYYMAPSLVVIASHFLFGERLNVKKGLCVLTAFVGMVLVSGIVVPDAGELKGILFGLGAAVLYACVILLNKRIELPSPMTRTVLQLGLAALMLLPYTMVTETLNAITLPTLGLLLVAGVVHTGIAYALYFGSVRELPGQTVALLSYVDPIVAIFLSALLLGEPLGATEIIGTCLILGAAFISEKD